MEYDIGLMMMQADFKNKEQDILRNMAITSLKGALNSGFINYEKYIEKSDIISKLYPYRSWRQWLDYQDIQKRKKLING